jgi:hypothetical protein
MKIEQACDLAASPAAVWNRLTDPRWVPVWAARIQRLEYPQGQATGAPVRLETGGKTLQARLVTWSPPSELVLTVSEQLFTLQVNCTLSPLGEGTRMRVTAEPRKLNPLVRPFVSAYLGQAEEWLAGYLDSLRRVTEGAVAGG